MELWKDIEGYEDHYIVSTLGRVASIKNGAKLLKGRLNSSGYLRVSLRKPGTLKNAFIHRLVASTFLKKVDGLDCINHIDCDKTNNTLSNLEWTNKSLNGKHAFKNGRLKILDNQKLSAKIRSKPILDKETGVYYDNSIDLSKTIGVSHKTIRKNIVKGSGKFCERYTR